MTKADPKSLALWLKQHYALIRIFIIVACSVPAARLAYLYFYGSLGINPLQVLQQNSGSWALVFLCISLAITPLRRLTTRLAQLMHSRYGKRLSDWNWIIKTRRLFGLTSFFYAAMHVFIYLHFDLGYDWEWALEDMQQKQYLVIGLVSFVIITTLALTSPFFMIRLLGKNWRRLHRSVYLLAILVLVHQWMAVKAGIYDPWYFSIIIALLLGYRLLSSLGIGLKKPFDDGMEVKPRNQS